MEEGAFDDLPHQGARLPLDDDSAAGDWALAHRMLRNAGAAPPWIESDKAVRAALLDERDRLLARASRRPSPSGLPRARVELTRDRRRRERRDRARQRRGADRRQHRRPLDLDAELDRLEQAAGSGDAEQRPSRRRSS